MKKISILMFLLFCSSAYAASFPNYYCPTTHKTIKVGDTLESVQANCDAPTSTQTRQIQVTAPVTTTVWTYTLGALSVKGLAFFLPALTITFDTNQNVSGISRAGSPITAGGYCTLSGSVNIGDPMNKVLSLCGQPSFVNTNQTNTTTTQNVLEWTYNFGPYQPQITLDFQNDVLTTISSGDLGS